MPSEFSPPGSHPRVTKAQIRKMQEQYKKAQEELKDLSEEEKAEKKVELDQLEDLLENEL